MGIKDNRPDEVVPNPDPSAITTSQIDKAVWNLEQRFNARVDGIETAVKVLHEDQTRVPTQLDRAIASLRDILETRLLCMENDIKSVHEFLNKGGQHIQEQVTHVRELVASNLDAVKGDIQKLEDVSIERFTRIDTQFIERDKRTDQLSLADKTAVAAALQAAKEAVGAQNTSNSIAISKSENSTIESIKQLQALFTTAISAMNDKINDLKSRLDRGEGRGGAIEPDMLAKVSAMNDKINALMLAGGRLAGRDQGIANSWGFIVGGVGLVVALVSLFVMVTKIVT